MNKEKNYNIQFNIKEPELEIKKLMEEHKTVEAQELWWKIEMDKRKKLIRL